MGVTSILKYARLPPDERRVVRAALWLLAAARYHVRRSGVPSARAAAARFAPRSRVPPPRLLELVAAAAAALPGATVCLPRAIALEALLVNAGHAAELRIGIAPRHRPEEPVRVDAHAWVEVDGRALGEDASGWLPLGRRA